jgi:hypothetical protein
VERRDDEWKSKIDHRLRAQVALSEGSPVEADRRVNVLVRFAGTVGSLQAYGLAVRSVAGDIAIASVTLADLPKAASAPEILFIELSQSLGLDAAREDEENRRISGSSEGKNENADE